MDEIKDLATLIKNYVDGKNENLKFERELSNKLNCYFLDDEMSWAEINAIVNLTVDGTLILIFKAGNYTESSFKLKSNTHVIMSEGAIFTTPGTLFLNFNNGDLNGEYTGKGNITIEGGTVNGQFAMFAHAENIEIKNVKMQNATKQYIMLTACKNVEIKKCEFNGINHAYNELECIELCGNHPDAFSYSSYNMYDGTPCQNIDVHHCTFNGDDTYKNKVCLGSHSNHYVHNNDTDKNISFHDNIVNYISYNMVTASYYENFNIYDNVVDGQAKGGTCFLWKTSSKSVNIYNNTIKNVKNLFASNQPYFVSQNAIIMYESTVLTPNFTQNLEVKYTLNDSKLTIKSTVEFIKIRTLTNVNITNLFDITSETINDKVYTVYTLKANTTTSGEQTILCVFAGVDRDVNPLMRNHQDVRIHDNNVYNVSGLMISAKRLQSIFVYDNHFENIQLPFKGWYTEYFEIKDNYLKNVVTNKRGFFTSYGGFECNVQDNIIDGYSGLYYDYAYWYITTVSTIDNFIDRTAYKKICKNNQLLNGNNLIRTQLAYDSIPIYNDSDIFLVRSSQINTSDNIDINVNLRQLDTLILTVGFVSQESYGINTITIKSFGANFEIGEKYIFSVTTYANTDTEFLNPIQKTGYIIINSITEPIIGVDEYENEDGEETEIPETSTTASSNIYVSVPDATQPIRKIYAGLLNKFVQM